jgi:UDP-GlcNAc:undecaprenyl-phosphate GlcNAc-1-phosphate transferase
MIINFFISIIISAAIAFFLTPLVRNFFIARSWVEDPQDKQKKTHNATAVSSVPRGGGLPIYIAVLVTSLIFLPPDKYLVGILLASLLTLIIGIWDDIKDISPGLRLITNILAAVIVVASGIGISYISNPFGGIINFSRNNLWLIADLLAIVWITWCMNITGWAAGIEGQLPGFVSISAVFIGILGLRFSQDTTQWPVIILAGAVAGSYLGFLPYNFFPQSIMPGYSGKSLAGFFLALLSILSGAKLATLLLLLGVPMIDAFFVLIRRLKNHRPLLVSDDQHLHHQLLKFGWSRPQIAVFYWLISLSLGFISLFLNSQQKLYVFIGLFFLFVGFILKISRRI